MQTEWEKRNRTKAQIEWERVHMNQKNTVYNFGNEILPTVLSRDTQINSEQAWNWKNPHRWMRPHQTPTVSSIGSNIIVKMLNKGYWTLYNAKQFVGSCVFPKWTVCVCARRSSFFPAKETGGKNHTSMGKIERQSVIIGFFCSLFDCNHRICFWFRWISAGICSVSFMWIVHGIVFCQFIYTTLKWARK